MKKDDVIIISCSVCGGMSHAVKKKEMGENYVLDKEMMICHKCGKVVLWEKMICDTNGHKRIYHIQCWNAEEEK